MKFRRSSLIIVVLLALSSFQFAFMSGAYAAENTNVTVGINYTFGDSVITVGVCNFGDTAVKQVDLDVNLTGFTVNEIDSDSGTIDTGSLVWTGTLQNDPDWSDDNHFPCLQVAFSGVPTNGVGTTMGGTVELESSILSDDTPNVDVSAVDDIATLEPKTAEASADMVVDTRLLTPGAIAADSQLAYSATLRNIGAGNYYHSGFSIFAFVIPEGSTFVGVEDADTEDIVSIQKDVNDEDMCFPVGLISNLGYPQLSGYTGSVVVCNLTVEGDGIVPSGGSYPLQVNIVAGATFATGEADVYGFFQGNDYDTFALQRMLVLGDDPFLLTDNNNAFHLQYDPSELQVTINRCPGQGETTSDGNACFRVSFNKPIPFGSFTEDDIDLGGVAVVSGFEYIGDDTWEVNVTGMSPGDVLTLLLSEASVQDYSAVLNNVNVLGINTVRYVSSSPVASNESSSNDGSASGLATANGTLSNTGTHAIDGVPTALLILCLGIVLTVLSSRKMTARLFPSK